MPTLEEMAATSRSSLSLEDMAATAKGPEISQFDSFDDQQKAHVRNALLYSGMSNRLPGEVYDYTSGINQQIHGSPDEVTAWKKNIGIIKETKSWGQAVEHGLILAGNQMNKTMKDAGWMVADLDQKFWKWAGARQPEIFKRWDEEAFELKRELDAYLEMFYKEHPEQLAETAPSTGYLEKALWYTENPKVVLQNTIQSAPIMLLGGLGKVAGLGKTGMIALFGGPTVAETYTEARTEGTDITPALAQALLTGGGEGAIEEWTFGRKIGIAQNFSKIVKGGWPKVAWEALKAYGRGTAEEGGQQANRNFWRFIFTDANQKISEGVTDAAAAGGPVELLMAGVFGMGGYTINKTANLVDQAEQHRRLNIIEGEIQKSQNFTDEQKAEISQEIDSVRQDVDSGVYLPEEEAVSTEKPPQVMPPTEVMPKIEPTGIAQEARTGLPAEQPLKTGAVQPTVAAAEAEPGAEAITTEALEKGTLPKEKTVTLTGTFFHNTDRESAEAIKKTGFKVEDASGLSRAERGLVEGNLGAGVYLSPDYAENMNFWGGESNLAVTPKRPLKLYSLGSEEGAASINLDKADEIRKQGYDGIIVNDPHPRSGGYQIVVFDPKLLKVESIVEDTDLTGEQLAKRNLKPAPAAEVPGAKGPAYNPPRGMTLDEFDQWVHSREGTPSGRAKSLNTQDQWDYYQQWQEENPPSQEPPAEPGAKPLEVETDLDKAELPSVTSARQAMIAEDRKALGLDEIASPDRKAWKESLSKAKEQGLDEKAMRIAAEVNSKPRPLSDEETAGVVLKAARLKNEYKGLMEKMSRTENQADVASLGAEAERVEQEFETLSKAIHLSGTEKGRALAAQKLTINQDYDLVSVVSRAKAAKGKSLTEAERATFAGLTTKLDAAIARIDALQEQVNELAAQRALRQRKGGRITQMTLEQRDTQLMNLKGRIQNLLDNGCY